MTRSTIENIVDRLTSELGPEVTPAQIEARAVEELTALEAVPEDASTSFFDVPFDITFHVRVDDCAGRLPATVASHVYDTIRRALANVSIPAENDPSSSGSESDTATDVVRHGRSLRIHGLGELTARFGPSDILHVCQTAERAALDFGISNISLLTLYAGKAATGTALIPVVSDLVKACESSDIELETGSSIVGIRSGEVFSIAHLLVNELDSNEQRKRLLHVANAENEHVFFRTQTTELFRDICVPVGRDVLDALRILPSDACYRDLFDALGLVGAAAYETGINRLASVGPVSNTSARVILSIDDLSSTSVPGHGSAFREPDRMAAGTSSPASELLKAGLLSQLPRVANADVTVDRAPLTDSLRNIGRYDTVADPALVAGLLVESFTGAVRYGYRRWLRLLAYDNDDAGAGADTGSKRRPSGPLLLLSQSWTDDQFIPGGPIVPSSNRPIS